MPRALLVYPEFPPSYWSYNYALEFVNQKATLPPLGLLTVAGLFPETYELKLIDLNVQPLSDEDLLWADFVFVSAMVVQRDSFAEVVRRCNELRLPVIAGGPYPTALWDELPGVDHVLVGEVEEFFAGFLSDLAAGKAQPVYRPQLDRQGAYCRPALARTPLPRFDLIVKEDYVDMAVQFSRGCPFDCEFCDITKMYGRMPRTKSPAQVLAEIQQLYEWGWRGSIFFVDDNFIGNAGAAMQLLPALAAWQKAKGYPFEFYTEASVNLAEKPELMRAMADAGFEMVFLGLESPNPDTLHQINKGQNTKAGSAEYLLWAVRQIQAHGMEVTAGFILGLDGDDERVFDAQIDFIQKAGIPSAMVGLLWAIKGTDLYARLQREGRLLDGQASGNNVSAALNFVPKIARPVLLAGYKRVLASLYEPSLKTYFERCFTLLTHWKRREHGADEGITLEEGSTVFKSLRRQVFSRQGPAYLKFLAKVARHYPRMLGTAVELAIAGYHFQKVTRQQILVDEFKELLEAERHSLRSLTMPGDLSARLQASYDLLGQRYRAIGADFRTTLDEMMTAFQTEMAELLLTGVFQPNLSAPLL